MELLLLSNSTIPGQPYLDWPKSLIKRFLPENAEVVFIPYAAVTFGYDAYEEMVQKALSEIGITVKSVHHAENPAAAIASATAVMIGGGNTFKLLTELYRNQLIEPLRMRIKGGMPFVGWSAGANVACQSIKTTNDMPIVQPPSFDALQLIPLQINPHYTERNIPGQAGESRMQRLQEYILMNDVPVLCLPEGCALKIQGEEWKLISSEPCKLLKPGGTIQTLQHGIIHI